MDHIAVDLGSRESQLCVRGSDGAMLEERRYPTGMLGQYLATRPKSRVVVETCSEAFGVADVAVAAGHEVRVVPATLVRSLGVGARRTKTDRRDAQILSEVSCRIDLPSVHIPTRLSRERASAKPEIRSLKMPDAHLPHEQRGAGLAGEGTVGPEIG